MELIQVTEHCYYSSHSEYGDRAVIGYIKSRNGAALIDAGNSEEHVKEFLQLIEERGLPKPTVVYLTHSHWDHVFGLSALDDKVKIVGTTRTSRKMNMENRELVDLAILIRDEAMLTNTPFEYIVSQMTLKESERFMLLKMNEEYNLHFEKIKIKIPNLQITNHSYSFDGYSYIPVKAFVLNSPHCPDSAIYLVESERVLFLGDALYRDFDKDEYSKYESRNFLIPFYRRIEKSNFEVAIPSHSRPMTKEEVLNYLRENYNIP